MVVFRVLQSLPRGWGAGIGDAVLASGGGHVNRCAGLTLAVNGDPRRKGMRTVLVAAAAAVVLVLAVLSGILVGRSQPVAATSTTSSVPKAPDATNYGFPAQGHHPSREPLTHEHSGFDAVCCRHSRTRLEVVATIAPSAPAPAAPRQAAPAAAAPPRTAIPEPTCPADAGVVLTINSA